MRFFLRVRMKVFNFLYKPIWLQYLCLHDIASGPEQATKTDICESHAWMRHGDPAHVNGTGQLDLLRGLLFQPDRRCMSLVGDPSSPDLSTIRFS